MTQQMPTASQAEVVAALREEGNALYATLSEMDTGYWTQHSSFKNWTVWDVIAHLHFSDHMALTSLTSEADFKALVQQLRSNRGGDATQQWLADHNGRQPTGPDLLERWRNLFVQLCEQLAAADPNQRFVWFGPGMKAKMFATARQMETWAHGWEIYDLMGMPREHSDRLVNIATIGVRTFAWTFSNRGLPVPDTPPHVCLTAPSGATWQWHEASHSDYIRGSAVEFCQVVTQVRNIADTRLEVEGDSAEAWMSIAQCFAGPPEDPPAPGSRTRISAN